MARHRCSPRARSSSASSAPSAPATPWPSRRTLARAVGARLILVAVYPVAGRSAVMPPRPTPRRLAEEAEATLEWVARPLSRRPPQSTRAVPCTSVARGLQEVARDERALAIVVGPSHRGRARAASSPAASASACCTARRAPSPSRRAATGRRPAADPAHRRRLRRPLPRPTRRSAPPSASPPERRGGPRPQRRRAAFRHGRSAIGLGLRRARADARATTSPQSLAASIDDVASPVEISGEVVDGYADDELARLSDEVDLLVCGSRGLGPLGRVMLGSVSAGVLRKARCPVLVVPRGAPDGFATLRARMHAAPGRRPSPVLREVVMTPPIVVGIDPLRHDPEAPVLAALLARATGAPVVAVAAYRTTFPLRLGGGDASRTSTGAPRSRGSPPSSRPSTASPLETVALLRAVGGAHVLHDCAEDRGAGLLVVGSTHHGAHRDASRSAARPTACCTARRARSRSRRSASPSACTASTASASPSSTAKRATRRCGPPPRSPRRAAPSCTPRPRSSRSPWSATSLAQPYDVEAHLDDLRGRRRDTLRARARRPRRRRAVRTPRCS